MQQRNYRPQRSRAGDVYSDNNSKRSLHRPHRSTHIDHTRTNHHEHDDCTDHDNHRAFGTRTRVRKCVHRSAAIGRSGRSPCCLLAEMRREDNFEDASRYEQVVLKGVDDDISGERRGQHRESPFLTTGKAAQSPRIYLQSARRPMAVRRLQMRVGARYFWVPGTKRYAS